MKLYRVTTIVKEFHDCKDVPFHWFRHDRGKRCAYDELIENYDPSDHDARDAEGAIDELFTDIEANVLKEYLDQEHAGAGVTTIEEVHLPIRSNCMGVGAIPVGGCNDFYMLSKEPTYTLPFEAWAYFDLRGCAPADGSSIYDSPCWGRQNEEAPSRKLQLHSKLIPGEPQEGDVTGHSPPAWLR
jgi:hypothetical protein